MALRKRLFLLFTTTVLAVGAAWAQASQSDAALQKAIEQRFAKSKIAEDRFTVRVNNGIATIEGKTQVSQRKGTATRLAKSAGARAVVNKIEIGQAAKDKAAANLAKGRRRAQVKRDETKRSETVARSEARSEAGTSTPDPKEDPEPPPRPKRAVVIR